MFLDESSDSISTRLKTGWNNLPVALTYSSADDPTYVVSTSADCTDFIGVGDKIKFTNNLTTFYGIIIAITVNSITLYGGTDYGVANSTITNPFFSHYKSPLGFPLNPAKWTVEFSDATERQQLTPTNGTWYNINSTSLTVPIGVWDLYYQVFFGAYDDDGLSLVTTEVTLSTGNNTESDPEMTCSALNYGAPTADNKMSCFNNGTRKQQVVLTSKTIYYLNARTITDNVDYITFANGSGNIGGNCIIRAICALL